METHRNADPVVTGQPELRTCAVTLEAGPHPGSWLSAGRCRVSECCLSAHPAPTPPGQCWAASSSTAPTSRSTLAPSQSQAASPGWAGGPPVHLCSPDAGRLAGPFGEGSGENKGSVTRKTPPAQGQVRGCWLGRAFLREAEPPFMLSPEHPSFSAQFTLPTQAADLFRSLSPSGDTATWRPPPRTAGLWTLPRALY